MVDYRTILPPQSSYRLHRRFNCSLQLNRRIARVQLCDGRRAQSEEDRAVDEARRRPDDDDAALQSVQAALQQSTGVRERH